MAKTHVDQVGHLAETPKLTHYGSGENAGVRVWMTVIANTRRTDQDTGEIREKATRISWTLFGKMAENAAKFLRKGSHVAVWGRIESDEYEKDGETNYSMSFIAEEVEYLDSKETAERRAARQGQADEPPM